MNNLIYLRNSHYLMCVCVGGGGGDWIEKRQRSQNQKYVCYACMATLAQKFHVTD